MSEKILSVNESANGWEVLETTSIEGVEYLLRDADNGIRFYVVQRIGEGSNSNRLYIGFRDNLREAQIKGIQDFKDGGTKEIYYCLEGFPGKLYLPTPMKELWPARDDYKHTIINLEKLVYPKARA